VSLILALASPVAASALTAVYLKATGTRGEVARNNSLGADVNDDLRRWVRDRDRLREGREGQIKLQTFSSEMQEAFQVLGREIFETTPQLGLADARRQALQEYRDQADRLRRMFRDRAQSEGVFHRLARRGKPEPTLRLPPDCREILARWRESAPHPSLESAEAAPVDDLSSPELEPALAAIESDEGYTWKAARRGKITNDQ
jgi:hypothetical protein